MLSKELKLVVYLFTKNSNDKTLMFKSLQNKSPYLRVIYSN